LHYFCNYLFQDFGVFVYVIGFLDPFTYDPISYINLIPNPNSNGNPSGDHGLLNGTCSSGGLNITKEGCVSTLFICVENNIIRGEIAHSKTRDHTSM
jgi:hypothetical protein